MMMKTNRWLWSLLLMGAAAGSGTLLSGCRGQLSDAPPVHLNPNMDQQHRFDPQEPSPFFRDRRAMRMPVEGTVARPQGRVSNQDSSFLKANDYLYAGMVNNAFVKNLPNRIVLNKALLERGQNRYNIYCVPCHGANGDGKGVVTLYSGAIRPRNFHETRNMPIGQIYRAIAFGAGTMRPMAAQLPVQDRWAIAAYVRALQLTRISSQSR